MSDFTLTAYVDDPFDVVLASFSAADGIADVAEDARGRLAGMIATLTDGQEGCDAA